MKQIFDITPAEDLSLSKKLMDYLNEEIDIDSASTGMEGLWLCRECYNTLELLATIIEKQAIIPSYNINEYRVDQISKMLWLLSFMEGMAQIQYQDIWLLSFAMKDMINSNKKLDKTTELLVPEALVKDDATTETEEDYSNVIYQVQPRLDQNAKYDKTGENIVITFATAIQRLLKVLDRASRDVAKLIPQ